MCNADQCNRKLCAQSLFVLQYWLISFSIRIESAKWLGFLFTCNDRSQANKMASTKYVHFKMQCKSHWFRLLFEFIILIAVVWRVWPQTRTCFRQLSRACVLWRLFVAYIRTAFQMHRKFWEKIEKKKAKKRKISMIEWRSRERFFTDINGAWGRTTNL